MFFLQKCTSSWLYNRRKTQHDFGDQPMYWNQGGRSTLRFLDLKRFSGLSQTRLDWRVFVQSQSSHFAAFLRSSWWITSQHQKNTERRQRFFNASEISHHPIIHHITSTLSCRRHDFSWHTWELMVFGHGFRTNRGKSKCTTCALWNDLRKLRKVRHTWVAQ